MDRTRRELSFSKGASGGGSRRPATLLLEAQATAGPAATADRPCLDPAWSAPRNRADSREWVQERRARTRQLIELGGLVQKAGLVELLDDDRATDAWCPAGSLADQLQAQGHAEEEPGRLKVRWRRRGLRVIRCGQAGGERLPHDPRRSPQDRAGDHGGSCDVSQPWSGCNKQRRQKEAAAFGQACGQAGFSPKQCAFLYAIREDARDRADESDALALVGLNAANVAAINAARR